MKWILGVVVASMALAGCDGPEAAPPAPTARAGQSSAAVTDCGRFDLGQGGDLPDSAVQCLIEAVNARRPAQLQTSALTVEGARIPITYTVGPDGRIEVVSDNRKDHFGSQKRTRQTCDGPFLTPDRVTVDFASCSPLETLPD